MTGASDKSDRAVVNGAASVSAVPASVPSARPKRNDPEIRQAAIASLAADCAKWENDASAENIADWVDCFRRVSISGNGYEIARDLENYGGVRPDAELVEILDCGSSYLWRAHDKAVEAWVSENDIRPTFADGQRVTYRGENGFIRGGEPKRGVYYFIPDGDEARFANGGGVCVDYELAQGIEAATADETGTVWTENLTDAQLRMVMDSGNEGFFPGGHGVDLTGSGAWKVARALVAKGLGTIEGGAPQGSSLPGLYFNNEEGARIVGEFDETEEDD